MAEVTLAPQAVPEPPATQSEPAPTELSFDQLISGIHKWYRRLQENDIAYRQISDTIQDKREALILNMPTGQRDANDAMITVALDFEALLKRMNAREPAQRKEILQQMLGPWNNYFVTEYSTSLKKLCEFTQRACEAVEKRTKTA